MYFLVIEIYLDLFGWINRHGFVALAFVFKMLKSGGTKRYIQGGLSYKFGQEYHHHLKMNLKILGH